jgi:beta-glucanase (GH16 family)
MLNTPVKKQKKPRKKSPGYLVVLALVILIVVAIPAGIAISIRAQQRQAANGMQNAAAYPGGLTGKWKQIFDDEFNGTSLDTSKWKPCYHSGNCTNSGNNELEWYLLENVTVSNGILHLRAKKQIYDAPDGKKYYYTSGMISSTNFSFTYGYVEMRARVTACKGMWSAFWMLPTDGSWPPEIDTQEVLGKDPTTVHMTHIPQKG